MVASQNIFFIMKGVAASFIKKYGNPLTGAAVALSLLEKLYFIF